MKAVLLVILSVAFPLFGFSAEINYTLNIDYKTINITGKNVKALALSKNGGAPSIPAPTLEFTEGDVAIITVQNNLDEEASLHWHGLLLPNDQDGVPHLTTPPIKAHSTFTYRFPLIHSGTYWYHSHTDFQEQRGIYGAFIIHPKTETLKYDAEQVIVLSDWTNRNPKEILNNLKTDPDWEQICKGTRRGWIEDIKDGTTKDRLTSEKNRMGPMDIADVCYDAFLMNGQKTVDFSNFKAGQRIRLRIINAAASSYFQVAFGKQPMEVVAADGMPVQPVRVSALQMAIAETYDVIITIPNDRSVELRATSADITGKSSGIFGNGPTEYAPDIKASNPYSMNMPMDGVGSGGYECKTGEHWDESMKMCMPGNDSSIKTQKTNELNVEPGCEPGEPGCDELFPLNYGLLKSIKKTTLPNLPTKEIQLDLTGDMLRYVWSFNNKVLGDADLIKIDKNTNVRVKFVNYTMMHHPLHLHGHFFRVLNGQNDFSPLKHTVDVGPMETLTIEFFADQEKDWIFHCHNLYHMTAGMARVFSYTNQGQVIPIDEMQSHQFHSQHKPMPMNDMSGTQVYSAAKVGATNAAMDAEFRAMNDKYNLNITAESDYEGKDYEIRAEGTKTISPNAKLGVGAQKDHDGAAARILINYRMPYLIDTTLGLGNRGIDYTIAKEFALKDGVSFDTKYGREYGLKKYGAFIKWRWKQNITFKIGISERKKFEAGIEVRN